MAVSVTNIVDRVRVYTNSISGGRLEDGDIREFVNNFFRFSRRRFLLPWSERVTELLFSRIHILIPRQAIWLFRNHHNYSLEAHKMIRQISYQRHKKSSRLRLTDTILINFAALRKASTTLSSKKTRRDYGE